MYGQPQITLCIHCWRRPAVHTLTSLVWCRGRRSRALSHLQNHTRCSARCLPGITTPIMFADGGTTTVQCASNDGASCLWGSCPTVETGSQPLGMACPGWIGTNNIAACVLLEQVKKTGGSGSGGGGGGGDEDNWGMSFLIVVMLCFTLYVGGGLGFAARQGGAPAALSSHLHCARWQGLAGLVADGVALTRARLQDGKDVGGGGYTPVGEAAAEDVVHVVAAAGDSSPDVED